MTEYYRVNRVHRDDVCKAIERFRDRGNAPLPIVKSISCMNMTSLLGTASPKPRASCLAAGSPTFFSFVGQI